MTEAAVRTWLGLYLLILTVVAGAYVLLCAGTRLLPIGHEEATSVFQIIVPVLVGQLVVVFRWYSGTHNDRADQNLDIPAWVVKGPPIAIATLLVIGVVWLIGITGREAAPAGQPAATFRALVTFTVTILNASTVFIISRYFPRRNSAEAV